MCDQKSFIPAEDPPARRPCCETFHRACLSGTDNEGYEALIRVEDDGSAVTGHDLPPIAFCPWCGSPVGNARPEPPSALERAFSEQPAADIVNRTLRKLADSSLTEPLFEFFKFDYEVTRDEFMASLPAAFAKIALTSEITVEAVVRYDTPGHPVMFLAAARGQRIENRDGEGAHRVI